MNDNTELLTWAVENITEWGDDYTHLRSDSSGVPLFFTYGDWFIDGVNDWHPIGRADHTSLYKNFSTKTPQVITKQEWQAAKLAALYRDSMQTPPKTAQEAPKGHIHAHLMAEYAEVAKTNPEPWREFQVSYGEDKPWATLEVHPSWNCVAKYRRKPTPPKTMKIGDIVVEACPLKHMPSPGWEYWSLGLSQNGLIVTEQTNNVCKFDEDMLHNGLAFSTQQEAQAVADALNSIYKKAVDEAWKS